MFNLLRADLYRLFRSKSLWVCLILCALAAIGMTVIGVYALSMADAQEVDHVLDQLRNGVDFNALEGSNEVVGLVMLGYGSFLSMMGSQVLLPTVMLFSSLVVVLQLSDDFETGFIKNLFSTRRSRNVYYGEKVLLIFVVSAVFLAVDTVAVLVSRFVVGAFYSSIEPPSEILLFFLGAWLIIAAYGLICAAIYWISRSKALGILAAALVSTGILMDLTMSVLQGAMPADVSNALFTWTITGVSDALVRQGSSLLSASEGLPALQMALTLVLWFVVLLIVIFTVCRRKDV